ncbi:MAG: Ferric reductase like transrane component [Actinomycetia bacterium]|nr:Ferric reductase like transrane component [Actinomycetes bacterium]
MGWLYLTRSSGIVALVLAVAALVGGLFFSARATGIRRKPNWWLDLHNWLGGLTLVFTVVHVVAAYLDVNSGIGLVAVFVPMTATGWAWGITWGVLATYVFAAVTFTSWPRKRLSRRTWLAVHLLSIPATVAAAGHAWMVGESRPYHWFPMLLALLAGLSVYPGVLRLARVLERRRRTAVTA